jgi:hypothetical protein
VIFAHQIRFITCDQRCDDHTLTKNTLVITLGGGTSGTYVSQFACFSLNLRNCLGPNALCAACVCTLFRFQVACSIAELTNSDGPCDCT